MTSSRGVIDQYQEETGNTVNYEVAPAVYIEWQQMMTTRLASGDDRHRRLPLRRLPGCHLRRRRLALAPLEPVVDLYDIDLDDWPQTLIYDVSSWDGSLYRIPWGNDTEIFFYLHRLFRGSGRVSALRLERTGRSRHSPHR